MPETTWSSPSAETEDANHQGQQVGDHLNAIAREPLTPLTKALLVVSLGLLLLSSIFVGLFAGLRHKLNVERGRHEPGWTPTITRTSTAMQTATTTKVIVSTTSVRMTTTVEPVPVPTPEKDVCSTPPCIVLAASILSSIDFSQDPCENFYGFTTNGWTRNNPLPADKVSFGNVAALEMKNKQVIQRVLESDNSVFQSPYDVEIVRKLRNFYKSCMNEDTLDKIGSAPLMELIGVLRKIYQNKDHDEGLSAENITPKRPDLTSALAYLHSQGIESLFSFKINGDVGEDPNRMVLWLGQASLGLPLKEYYLDNEVLDMYRTTVETLLVSLLDEDQISAGYSNSLFTTNADSESWPGWPWPPWGGDDDDDDDGSGRDHEPVNHTHQAQRLAKHIIEFEKKLASASLDHNTLFQDAIAAYNPFPVSKLTDYLPQVDFPTYLSAFTLHSYPDKVIVTHPPYLKSLAHILDDTDMEIVEAYLVFRTALALSPYLGESTDERRAQGALQDFLTGVNKKAVGDRSEYCVGKLEETFGFATGRYFVNETFTDDSRRIGEKVIKGIVKSFRTSFSELDWMDTSSATSAVDKSDAIRISLGYPDSPDTWDPASIARYYESLSVDPIHFFWNMINAVKQSQIKKWIKLGQSRNPDSWEILPSSTDAYLDSPTNEIYVPAGIFQPPFFGVEWPSYILYGSLGHVVAHELTHAFDSIGSQYTQAGKLEQWWSNATADHFRVKRNCIAKQFSEYTINDMEGNKIHVDGNLTSVENIGDAGLIQAFRAWKSQFGSSFENGHEKLLPGMNFTREQLFFISFARVFANTVKPEEAMRRARFDPHSPARYRVDGTVSNIPEFAVAFNCSVTSKLNPPRKERCMIWER